MKRAWLGVLAASLVSLVAGCAHHHVACLPGNDVQACGRRALVARHRAACPVHGNACGGACREARAFDPVPPMAQITYPYYTVRGPRDFLQRVPTPIGP